MSGEWEYVGRASRKTTRTDEKGQDSQAHWKITPSRRSLVHVKRFTGDSPTSDDSKDSVIQDPPTSRHVGHGGRHTGEPASGDTKKDRPTQLEDEELHAADRRRPASPGRSEDGSPVSNTVTPRKLAARNQTPVKAEGAADPPDTPRNLSSRKRRMSVKAEVLVTETQNQPSLTQCLAPVEKKPPKDSLGKPEKLAPAAAQLGSGLPGLSSADVSNFGNSTNKSEGTSLKRRRVSFGGRLRPELFDENLPPNTPLKRGETPTKRKSLITHTPAVLKKIIKGQPQSLGKEEPPGLCAEVTAQVCVAAAPSPGKTPSRANDQRRRSSRTSPASSRNKSLHETDVPKKERKTGNLPPKRASISRGQHDILQMICSKRRSGASEANLIVAKSWADIVKLGVKQTQTKVVKHVPPKQTSKRPRRPNSPKEELIPEKWLCPSICFQYFPLLGLTEMFKTPGKEKQRTNTGIIIFSNSENLPGKQLLVPNSGDKPLPVSSEILGESVLSSAQDATEEPYDKYSASPALRQRRSKGGDTAQTPETVYKTTPAEKKVPDSVTGPLKTIYSANKFRSRELGGAQVPRVESQNGGTEADLAEGITGRHPRRTPVQGQQLDGRTRDSEQSSRRHKENVESKDLARTSAVRRSSGREQRCGSTEGLSGSQVISQTQEKGTTKVPCRTSQPEAANTPKSRRRGLVSEVVCSEVVKEELSAPGRVTRPEESMHTSSAPTGDDASIQEFKAASAQKVVLKESEYQILDPAVRGIKRQAEKAEEKAQSLEDLTGFPELFQSPALGKRLQTTDKTTKTPGPVRAPASTKRLPKSSLGKVDVSKELSAVGGRTQTLGRGTPTVPAQEENDATSIVETPKQKLDFTERLTGRKRRSRTPKYRTESLEDLAGFQELFQTPVCASDPATVTLTKISLKSPQLGPTRTPKSAKKSPQTSLENVDVQEEIPTLGRLTQSPDRAEKTPTAPTKQEKGIEAIVETSKQKLEPVRNLTRLKRHAGTPKAQPLEDLAGFQELFQTPGHGNGPLPVDKVTEMPFNSPQSEPVRIPTSIKRSSKTSMGKIDVKEEFSEGEKLLQTEETAHTLQGPDSDKGLRPPKQSAKPKWNPAVSVPHSKRLRLTPKVKAQPLEDLTGFQQLFQTPGCTTDSVTVGETTELPYESPQPGLIRTPASTKRLPRKSTEKGDAGEELSVLRNLTQSPGKGTPIPTAPVRQRKGMKSLTETPKQRLDSTENVPGRKGWPQTPKEKVQPLEDLAGFQELFQTPVCAKDSGTVGKTTNVPLESATFAGTPMSMKRLPKTSLGKVDATEELPAVRKLTQSPEKATHTPRPPAQEGAVAIMKTAKQFLESAGGLTGCKRQAQTPRRSSQLLEDLVGFQELFQTPAHANDLVTVSLTRMSLKSPQPEPTRTPQSAKKSPKTSLGNMDVRKEASPLTKPGRVLGELIPTAKLPQGGGGRSKDLKDSAARTWGSVSVTSSKRQGGTHQEKSQPLEDLFGLQELFQTPDHGTNSVTVDKVTEMPCRSPPPEPVGAPVTSKRQPRTRLGEVRVKTEPLGVKKLPETVGETEDKGLRSRRQCAKRKLDTASAAGVSGSKRRRGACKEASQPLEDLTGSQELFQTLSCAGGLMPVNETTKMPGRSPEPMDTSSKTRPGTRVRKMVVIQEPAAQRRPPRTSRETRNAHQEPVSDSKDIREQKQEPAPSVPSSRRPARVPKKAQPREQASVQEEAATDVSSDGPQPERKDSPASPRRQLRTRPQRVDVKEEPAAQGRLPGRETRRAPREPGSQGGRAQEPAEPAKRKLELAAALPGTKRPRRAPRGTAQPLEELVDPKGPVQTAGHTGESASDERPGDSPRPELAEPPQTSPAQPRTRRRKADVSGGWTAEGKTARTSRQTTRSLKAPGVDGEDPQIEPAQQKWDRVASVTSSRRRLRVPKEDLTGSREMIQTPGHTEQLGSSTRGPKSPPKQTSDPVKPSRARRRVLRTPVEKLARVLVDTRDPAASQSNTSDTLPPERKSEREERVSRTRGLRSAAQVQGAPDEQPSLGRQTAAPKRGPAPELPERTRLTMVTHGVEHVEEQMSYLVKTRGEEPKVEDLVTPDQRVLLRSRHQKKTGGDQQRPQAKENKRTRNSSQETQLRNPDHGVRKPASRATADRERSGLRSGGPSASSRGHTADKTASEKGRKTQTKAQKEKGVSGDSGVRRLRSGKTRATLDSAPEPRATRGAKKGAENPKEDKDIVYTKKLRTRSCRDSEDI
ncbi:proliferation marker protein Ki-67 [Nannospalax galili]|uniref:proliferation marker protein Ki-67 n=1 Tax=Nannospalax galili TaxID=1026970 RepID=UPI00111C4777|nr:proliferation marker protein Ki-67 [Nannospalax galili]